MAFVYWAKPANAPLQLSHRDDQRQGLIGFKIRALINNPSRSRDLDDIRALLRAQRGKLNIAEVREYFALFDRLDLLDELLVEIADEAS